MKANSLFAVSAAALLSVAEGAANITKLYAPEHMPTVDRHDTNNVYPSTNVSLHYASNTTLAIDTNINVTHAMKYPSVLLESIATVLSVECSTSSVVITFNDSTVFDLASSSWEAEEAVVFVTNFNGSCDATNERGFFLSSSVSCDTLVCTAVSDQTDVASTASRTEITFGGLEAGITKRNTVLDPSFTVSTSEALTADTTLYTYSPYVTVTADSASFSAAITFSGYLSFNWWTLSMTELYFDIDVDSSAEAEITADITASYDKTFTYSPSELSYTLISVPGVLELGPALAFSIGAEISASEAVTLTAGASVALADGNVHLDLVDEDSTSTSGWTPTYSVSANISGEVVAEINPTAGLTVEMSISFFSGLIDLSSGLTATPGFDNSFVVTAAEGLDLTGVTGLASDGTCSEGLELASNFTFAVDAFVGTLWSDTLYSVTVPIVDECFTWE
jgi:hypothetical protein